MRVRPAGIQRLYSLQLRDSSLVVAFEHQEKGACQSAVGAIRRKLQHVATADTHNAQVAQGKISLRYPQMRPWRRWVKLNRPRKGGGRFRDPPLKQ